MGSIINESISAGDKKFVIAKMPYGETAVFPTASLLKDLESVIDNTNKKNKMKSILKRRRMIMKTR